MSIGKSSVARAAKATAKPAEEAPAVVAEEVKQEPAVPAAAPEKEKKNKKFESVRVGDNMPAFLL